MVLTCMSLFLKVLDERTFVCYVQSITNCSRFTQMKNFIKRTSACVLWKNSQRLATTLANSRHSFSTHSPVPFSVSVSKFRKSYSHTSCNFAKSSLDISASFSFTTFGYFPVPFPLVDLYSEVGSHNVLFLSTSYHSPLYGVQPAMEHNLVQYREQLLREDCYAAAHNFRHSFSWLSQRTGDILIEDKSKQNAVISVVARVLDNRFDCTAAGNLGNRPLDKLPSVKFQLLLGKPTDTVFADDFNKVLDNLNQISNNAAPGEKKENLIVTECGVDVLRFTCPVFEQQRPPVRGSVAGGSSRTFLHDELLYKILLRLLRVG